MTSTFRPLSDRLVAVVEVVAKQPQILRIPSHLELSLSLRVCATSGTPSTQGLSTGGHTHVEQSMASSHQALVGDPVGIEAPTTTDRFVMYAPGIVGTTGIRGTDALVGQSLDLTLHIQYL